MKLEKNKTKIEIEETILFPAPSGSSLSPISIRTLSPAPIIAPFPTIITASLRSKICGLRDHAEWIFRCIAKEVGVPASTIYSLCRAPATPRKAKPGRPKVLTTHIRKRLVVDFATASQMNRQPSFIQVTDLTGITADIQTLSLHLPLRVTTGDSLIHTHIYHLNLKKSGLTAPITMQIRLGLTGIKSGFFSFQFFLFLSSKLMVRKYLYT